MKSELNSKILSEADLEVLGCLRKNARETLTRISRDLRIPISSVFDKLKRLEEIGVITRHTSLLDMEKIGLRVRLILSLKVDRLAKDDLERFLIENQQVNNLSRVNGSWDYFVEALFRKMEDAETFIDTLRSNFKGIQISDHYILEDLKCENFLAGSQKLVEQKDQPLPLFH